MGPGAGGQGPGAGGLGEPEVGSDEAARKKRKLVPHGSDAHMQTIADLDSRLADTVFMWHDAMSSFTSDLHLEWIGAFRTFVSSLGGRSLKIGSMFSGCDILDPVLGTLADVWARLYDVVFPYNIVFACERDEAKVQFLRHVFAPSRLFRDAQELGNLTAYCLTEEAMVPVPYTDLLVAGFPCTSRSSLSVHAARNKGCVAAGTSATGEGFAAVLGYIDSCKPKFVLLENVPGLAQSSGGSGVGGEGSDADFVVAQLRSRSYWATQVTLEARDYGSFATRSRIYFVASTCRRANSEEFFARALTAMEIGAGLGASFIFQTERERVEAEGRFCLLPTTKDSKGGKADAKTRTEQK